MTRNLTLNEYQQATSKTASFEGGQSIPPAVYCALGLAGETGEYVEKIKKLIRDGNGVPARATEAVAKELGDVLWYLAQSAKHIGYTLEEVAQLNLDKLDGRVERGTLSGSGDNR